MEILILVLMMKNIYYKNNTYDYNNINVISVEKSFYLNLYLIM